MIDFFLISESQPLDAESIISQANKTSTPKRGRGGRKKSTRPPSPTNRRRSRHKKLKYLLKIIDKQSCVIHRQKSGLGVIQKLRRQVEVAICLPQVM